MDHIIISIIILTLKINHGTPITGAEGRGLLRDFGSHLQAPWRGKTLAKDGENVGRCTRQMASFILKKHEPSGKLGGFP